MNVMQITKRDGAMEQFIPEKIAVSCIKSGAPPEAARQISRMIENKAKDRMATSEIRKMAMEQLRQRNPQWEQNWLLYDRAVKRKTL